VTNIHKVLTRWIYLKDMIEDRSSFTGHMPFSGPDLPRDYLVFWRTYIAKEFTLEKEIYN
jgi:hypothetical protein